MLKNLYHGSKKIIEKPQFGKGNPFNDYGLAFYTTEDINLASEWAVDWEQSGYINQYEMDFSEMNILDLSDKRYSILNWLAILVDNRTFEMQTDFGVEAKDYLIDNFLPDYKKYDVIIGYRADDSYFSFAQDFLNNTISVDTLANAMYLGDLGMQVAIKSEKAFDKIRYVGSEKVSSKIWFPKKEMRDESARKKYFEMRNKPWKRGEMYLMMIIDQEIKGDDIRIRPDIII